VSLNLKALLAMRAVIADGTVTAAAQRLHRTQPVVSRLIAQLESSVGFALFRREGRRLLPTPEGLTFYRETERALSALSEIESSARDIRERRDAPVRILAQSHMVHGLLHVALGDFCRHNPAFRFSIEIRQREYISHWIANRQFDVGFAPKPVDHPQVESQLFVRAPLFIVMPGAHPLANKRQISVSDLVKEPIIATRPGSPLRKWLDAMFAEIGVVPQIRGETFTAVSACQLAGRGIGVALADPFVPSLFLDDPAICIRPLSPQVEHEYLVLRPAGHSSNQLVEQFIDCAKAASRRVVEEVMRHASGSGRNVSRKLGASRRR
jgi:DNA-binding transcriptional LysR family regulator